MGFWQKFIHSGAFYAYKKRGDLNRFRTARFHRVTGPIAGLGGSWSIQCLNSLIE